MFSKMGGQIMVKFLIIIKIICTRIYEEFWSFAIVTSMQYMFNEYVAFFFN